MPGGRPRREPAEGLAHSLTSALLVLERLATQHEPMSLRDLAGGVGMPKSSVHWLLATLKARAFVIQESSTGKYAVGPMAWAVGLGAPQAARIREAAREPLRRMQESTGEAVFVTLFSQGSTYLVDFIRGLGMVTVAGYPGLRLPAWATAAGRVALALQPVESPLDQVGPGLAPAEGLHDPVALANSLADIRARGWECGREIEGACEIAAPLRDGNRIGIGAVGVIMPARLSGERWDPLLVEAVQDTAEEISLRLGYTPPSIAPLMLT